MKNVYLMLLTGFILVNCSSINKINKSIISGNFDKAINETISKLNKIQNKKKKSEYVLILNDVYHKAVDKNVSEINRLKTDGNPEYFREIYEKYLFLDQIQNKITAILPIKANNKSVDFSFTNYNDNIIDYRYKVSEYYYNIANELMLANTKTNYRKAYYLFEYIEQINPNYKNVHNLFNISYYKGKDYVLFNVLNKSGKIIDKKLEDEILDFKTYGLKTLWQNYYSKEDDSLDFDFQINLIFNNIEISPEIMNEKEKIKKRTVKGWTYKLDSKGNIMKDSLGIDIKVDKVIDISVRTIEFRQSKAAKVVSEVQIINKKNNYIIDRFPLTSQFIFENIFMKYFGDIRALERRDRILIKKRFIPYPPDEVLVYDNSEMIKNKLKYIIINYNFSE